MVLSKLFSGSVNSPHKVPNNNQGTPNHHVATPPPNRNKVGGPISATPGSARPGTGRRREASDAAAGGNPFSGTPTQLQRRRTDLRDSEDAGSPTGRTFFGRWGSAAGTGDEENKEKEDPAGTGGRNTGLFRRGSAAWGSSSNTGVGSTSALNSPMGTFGNNTFGGGGAMGGFTLQPSDKQKKGSSSVSRPGVVDVDERAEEEEGQRAALPDAVQELRQSDDRERPTSSDTDPFGIGGDRDDHNQQHDQRTQNNNAFDHQQHVKTSSPFGGISISTSNMNARGNSAISTPTKTRSDLGFTPFGGSRDGPGNNMMNMGMSGLQHQLQNLQFNNQGQVPLRRSREGSLGGALAGDNEPLSPAETNPFMSPPPEKADEHEMMNDLNEGGGLGSVIAGLRRGEASGSAAVGSDRSGRSSTAGLGSVGGALGGGGFGGLGSAGLWSSTAQMGTPGGSGATAGPGSFFGGTSLAELASPGGPGSGSLLSGGLGGVGPLGGQGFGSASRASRLGQLFPENQHQDDQGFESDAFGPDPRYNAFGSRRGLGGAMESPMRERGDVNDLFGFPNSRSFSNLSGAAASQDNTVYQRSSQDPLGLQPSHEAQHGSPLGQQNAQATAAGVVRPPPGAIPPVMVMPDKINWVYRDPSGTIQGPFSGLEMHEWYRAGFFTQDLAVKRAEDTEFEQLGLLVRRIGNTREPFLVPLPGNTSAGMSTNAASANWSETWLNEMQGAPQQAQAQTPGSMQPPFAGSFPTFGTTLTAEQQNALERRKQEEQYLMAKQREFLLQQQMMAKQATMAQQLHHQSSTQSLHSQPSFGSLHSPSGFPPTSAPAAPIASGQNAFEPGVLLRQAGAAAGGNDPLNIGGQVSGMQVPGGQFPPQAHQQQEQVLQMQQQQHRLAEQQRQQQLQRNYQTQQTQHVEKQLQDAQEQQAQQVHIQQLQQHHDAEQEQVEAEQQQQNPEFEAAQAVEEAAAAAAKAAEQPKVTIPKAAPAPIKTSPPAKPVESPWGATPMVQPFPPPPSQESPTQAAAASPAAETPSASVAPWAKEAEQAVKTPSLKEIQEIEAKQAAVREAAEAQARREMLAQQALQAPPPPAPGLPSTATWATSPSSTPSAGGASAWNKPLAKANSSSSSSRKTLQQIQKEEEARKAKNQANVASQAAVASTQPLVSSVGKRYADLASKTAAAGGDKGAFPPGTTAWTTVGPGGKSKGAGASPAPPTPAAPAVKTMGSGIGLISAAASAPKKPTTPVPSAKPITSSAQDEFLKWCRGSMKGLNSGVTRKFILATSVSKQC